MVRKKIKYTAQEYLELYRYNEMELDRIQQTITQKRQSAYGVSGIAYDGDKVQSSGKNPSEERIYKYLQSVEKYEKQIEEINQQQDEIRRAIEKVQNMRYKQILRYRYLSGLNIALVANLMNYSEVHTSRLHKSAIDEFAAVNGLNVM